MGPLNGEAMESPSEVEALRKQVATLAEEKVQLEEQVKDLKRRCQTLACAAAQPQPLGKEVATQTETVETATPDGQRAARSEAGSRPAPLVDQMLRRPDDVPVQLHGIEALFAQQTQEDSNEAAISTPALQYSLEAAVAILRNHPSNHALLLKAVQFLSVFFKEPNVQQQLPSADFFQAAQSVVAVSVQLLGDDGVPDAREGPEVPRNLGLPNISKLMTWCLSLQALLLPCIAPQLQDRTQGEPFLRDLLQELVSKLLTYAEALQEALLLKCVQLVPLLPMVPWVQRLCLDSTTIHSLAFAYHRCVSGSKSSEAAAEAALPKAITSVVRGIFSENLELCVKALDDTFVGDHFVCLEVLDELRELDKKRRGTLRALDSDWGIIGKALGLWAFHERRALEDKKPLSSPSREVLQKVADLTSAVLLRLPPGVLLQRMQDFQHVEVLQRIALAAVHANPQLRLQLAVNYTENSIITVVIGCMQMLLQHYECSAPGTNPPAPSVDAAFQLLKDGQHPQEAWPYLLYCLEICLHVLSHWSATKPSLRQKADVMDSRAAPLLLAKGGLVDVLAEIIDAPAAGIELTAKAPAAVLRKASETLQALFEHNSHICLFCMQHYSEMKQMVSIGCDSLVLDPLAEFPQMQQQAVDQLMASFERFSVNVDDERITKKILKALTVLFESSYHLVAWFLQHHPPSSLGECLHVHVQAVRAIAQAPYWSAEDVPLLPEFVALLVQLLLGSIEGHGDEVPAMLSAAPARAPSRIIDLTEAEQVVSGCMAAVLHLLLIDPSPPTVLHCLAQSLGQQVTADSELVPPAEAGVNGQFERAVNSLMRVMQVFPSSARLQLNCQHLLTSLLGE